MYIIYLLKHLKENYKKVTAVVNNVEAIWNLTLLSTRVRRVTTGGRLQQQLSPVSWQGSGV